MDKETCITGRFFLVLLCIIAKTGRSILSSIRTLGWDEMGWKHRYLRRSIYPTVRTDRCVFVFAEEMAH
jgi:hypothetical protein